MSQGNQLPLMGSCSPSTPDGRLDATSAESAFGLGSVAAGDETLGAVQRCLARFQFNFSNEKELQEGIESALADAMIPFRREVHLAAGDVADFIVQPGVCVEVKIGGGLSALTRQLHRYAQHARVGSILVVTSKAALCHLPERLNGKRVIALVLRGGLR